jgi:hypothetical protein
MEDKIRLQDEVLTAQREADQLKNKLATLRFEHNNAIEKMFKQIEELNNSEQDILKIAFQKQQILLQLQKSVDNSPKPSQLRENTTQTTADYKPIEFVGQPVTVTKAIPKTIKDSSPLNAPIMIDGQCSDSAHLHYEAVNSQLAYKVDELESKMQLSTDLVSTLRIKNSKLKNLYESTENQLKGIKAELSAFQQKELSMHRKYESALLAEQRKTKYLHNLDMRKALLCSETEYKSEREDMLVRFNGLNEQLSKLRVQGNSSAEAKREAFHRLAFEKDDYAANDRINHLNGELRDVKRTLLYTEEKLKLSERNSDTERRTRLSQAPVQQQPALKSHEQFDLIQHLSSEKDIETANYRIEQLNRELREVKVTLRDSQEKLKLSEERFDSQRKHIHALHKLRPLVPATLGYSFQENYEDSKPSAGDMAMKIQLETLLKRNFDLEFKRQVMEEAHQRLKKEKRELLALVKSLRMSHSGAIPSAKLVNNITFNSKDKVESLVAANSTLLKHLRAREIQHQQQTEVHSDLY